MRLARFLIILSSLMVGCGQQTRNSSAFTKAEVPCQGAVLKGRYIVHWRDGRRTVEYAATDEQFVDEFVTPLEEEIAFAEPDFIVHTQERVMAESVLPTTFADNWGAQRTHAEALWRQNVRGDGVTVAVIDTGMDVFHPQLRSQIALNQGESGVASTNGADDDRNGYVDDFYGYDFANNRGLSGDNQFHGTHVAGVIAAAHTEETARGGNHVQGLAPNAKILPLAFLSSDGSGTISDALSAVDYAVARGARVINASWGGAACSVSLRDKINSLYYRGVVFVSAAGNSSQDIDVQPEYPAAFNLLAQFTVGSITMGDFMAEHSNYGARSVHIFAPGSDIVSTVPGGQMAPLTGTSMATPFVSGAIALLLSAEPGANVDQIRQAIYQSAVRSNSYLNASRGRLDLNSALSTLRSLLRP